MSWVCAESSICRLFRRLCALKLSPAINGLPPALGSLSFSRSPSSTPSSQASLRTELSRHSQQNEATANLRNDSARFGPDKCPAHHANVRFRRRNSRFGPFSFFATPHTRQRPRVTLLRPPFPARPQKTGQLRPNLSMGLGPKPLLRRTQDSDSAPTRPDVKDMTTSANAPTTFTSVMAAYPRLGFAAHQDFR